jgi:hypothetical protein
MSKKSQNSGFNGFEQSNTTPVPDVLFDELLSELSGSELKVLLYIIRRTAGFKKTTDAISLTQFEKGITTREGKQLDRGCGIKRRQTIIDALASLEEKGYIVSSKAKTSEGDDATTVYQVRFKGVVSKPDYPSSSPKGSFKTGLPSYNTGLGVVDKTVPPVVAKTGLPVVSKPYPQETVIQETVLQETERQESVAPTSAQELQTSSQPEPSSPSLSQKNLSSFSSAEEEPTEEAKPIPVDYALFDRLCRAKGYAPTFKVPRNDKNNAAIKELREQGANAKQVEFVFNDIWDDKDPFWKQHRGKPSTVASQFTARVWKMTQPTPKRRTVSGFTNWTEDKTVGVPAIVEPVVSKPASIPEPKPAMPEPVPAMPKEPSLPVGYTRLKIDKPARPRTAYGRRLQAEKEAQGGVM